MADRIYRTALPMLRRDMAAAPFRLIGVGLAGLSRGATNSELAARTCSIPMLPRRLAAEGAADRIRAKFGHDSIRLGPLPALKHRTARRARVFLGTVHENFRALAKKSGSAG